MKSRNSVTYDMFTFVILPVEKLFVAGLAHWNNDSNKIGSLERGMLYNYFIGDVIGSFCLYLSPGSIMLYPQINFNTVVLL